MLFAAVAVFVVVFVAVFDAVFVAVFVAVLEFGSESVWHVFVFGCVLQVLCAVLFVFDFALLLRVLSVLAASRLMLFVLVLFGAVQTVSVSAFVLLQLPGLLPAVLLCLVGLSL